ncbi:MAG: ferredoxin [Bacteriovoracaceae bacterium]
MNTSIMAMGIAVLLSLGLVVAFGAFSLLTGAFYFLFGRSSFEILSSKKGSNGFCFGYKWNSARVNSKFDKVRLRLYNPFGSPTQVDVSHEFASKSSSFAVDLDMGPGFSKMIEASGLEKATVEIELSSKDGTTMYRRINGKTFVDKLSMADQTMEEFNHQNKVEYQKPLYQTVQKSFIADPLPRSDKTLKIATNPEFAGQFAGAAGGDAPVQENYAVSKVWIEPGCIVCNACEAIFPEVFEVTDETCLIRPEAPLDNGLLIEEAAEACPVEVIKFTKAG